MAVSRLRARPGNGAADDPEARIAALIDAHGAALQRTARHFSLCADDAHDAVQRALEIYLRRLETVDVATEGAWLKVVVRHEAMAVRRSRSESVASEEVDFETRADDDLRPLEDHLFGAERSARSAEALRRLKPDEARALMLKAEGHSYAEIGESEGWTYTKTNRSITEGRRHFLSAYAELEAKEACDAFGPALAQLVQGTASAETVMGLRPHLRHCPACRATVRELRGGRRRVAAWLPLPVAAWLARPRGRVLDRDTNAAEAGFELRDEPVVLVNPGRWAELKLQFHNLVHRFTGSDVATSVQIASTGGGGGGRTASIAALIGFCISGVGAGTYCVATLVLPTEPPKPVVREAEERPRREVRPRRVDPKQDRPTIYASARQPIPRATATATPTPAPAPRKPPVRRTHRTARSGGTSSSGSSAAYNAANRSVAPEVRHESAPPPVPAAEGQQEIGFERSAVAPAVKSSPAAAPTTGGGEFGP